MGSTYLPPSATPRMPNSLPALRRKLPIHHSKKARRYVLSCKASTDGRVDRRDVLLRLLGGTAAAAGLSTHSAALAAPIESPDLSNCHRSHIPPQADINCCPPYSAGTRITDFKLPPAGSPLRVRPAAHLVDRKYLAKYERAVKLMKQLPASDPRSFSQQWHVHCAYCDGAYLQVGSNDLQIQVHGSWLFFPWHRLYVYFHERILGKLIGDDTFALPFWNWDAPDGMTLPEIYNKKASPLYDTRRNQRHLPPFLLDLNYSCTRTDPAIPRDEQIDQNLKTMYRQMISGAKKTELFLGQPYRSGSKPYPGAGSVEQVPHNTVHAWTGDPMENNEDMGVLYSAARDPVFFAHHGNVDRMWHIWRRLGHKNFTDADWLDANFLFYDEEARLVRVRVRDCLDTSALRYTYQDVPLPWLGARPTKAAGGPTAWNTDALPTTLEKTKRFTVTRPRTSRTRKEKEEEEEVLIIEGIEIADPSKYVKVDVYVNEPESGGVNPASAEFAGSVTLTPHKTQHKEEDGTIETTAKFGISDLLDEIGADGDKTIFVSLVPRCAGESVTVHSISIGYVK